MAWIIQASNALFNGSATPWVIAVYYVGLTVIIGSIIWLIIYVSPNLIQTALGQKTKSVQPPAPEPQASNLPMPPKEYPASAVESPAPVQAKWVPIAQPASGVVDEESDSEKLRREFRNRSF